MLIHLNPSQEGFWDTWTATIDLTELCESDGKCDEDHHKIYPKRKMQKMFDLIVKYSSDLQKYGIEQYLATSYPKMLDYFDKACRNNKVRL